MTLFSVYVNFPITFSRRTFNVLVYAIDKAAAIEEVISMITLGGGGDVSRAVITASPL